jgi:hypothetical protein
MPGSIWANTADGSVAGNLEDCEEGFYCTVGEYAPNSQGAGYVTNETGLAF